ncbi:hypothetical protein ADIMK_1115 [Marinobacterium lacunae]|uniref:Uncharacterized protein n=1 Tax=Marinobacterium lacunae TaxID=1232683 RepID=A0A081G1K7_9GAMM|nr:hypothetical protein [Marinobacterium lacunae]KEA64662.1 hypothetical protein ADIMK_1115 [Marinobacterium lacunae]MBR9882503.1 hypothetical protein [Oceanospirillales bacterium]
MTQYNRTLFSLLGVGLMALLLLQVPQSYALEKRNLNQPALVEGLFNLELSDSTTLDPDHSAAVFDVFRLPEPGVSITPTAHSVQSVAVSPAKLPPSRAPPID